LEDGGVGGNHFWRKEVWGGNYFWRTEVWVEITPGGGRGEVTPGGGRSEITIGGERGGVKSLLVERGVE